MRRFGKFLSAIGLGLGVLLGVGLLVPLHINGLMWLVAIGGFKLGLASSLGLIASGAVLQRLGRQREELTKLPRSEDP